LNEKVKNENINIKELPEILIAKNEDKGDVAWWEKNNNSDNKFAKNKVRINETIKITEHDKYSNPFVFNEGNVDLDSYFHSLISKVGERVLDISDELLTRLHRMGILVIFGVKV